ncbi:MAG TPA: PPOX class F420-dependent oxidoreductase [Terriglobales bacterium]|nr:PPOX class F420-dependent oxidoreductase [Terriglobales bacterium]
MATKLSEQIIALIDNRNFAHLASVMADGSPHSAPVWLGREGQHILISTSSDSVKAKNTRRDPRVAISIVDLKDPYTEVQLRGRVVEQRPDPELKYLDAVSQKYVGKPFPFRGEAQVALVIEIDKAKYEKIPFEHAA